MRIEKQELRKRWAELRTLVNEWDPIGLIEAGAPVDEYECIVGPLLRQLEEGTTERQIAEYLSHELTEHFSVRVVETAEFTARAKSWYEEKWPGTAAV